MTNAILISTLFNHQDKFFIEFLYTKNLDTLTSLGKYIKEKSLKNIPYDKEDFGHLIFKAIKQLRNVRSEQIHRFGYFLILKKIFVQQMINVNRRFCTNKELILSLANNNLFINYNHHDNFLSDKYSHYHDVNKLYTSIISKMKKNIDKRIFNLYLNSVKPQTIAKMLNQPVKHVYNTIFLIKNHYQKSCNITQLY